MPGSFSYNGPETNSKIQSLQFKYSYSRNRREVCDLIHELLALDGLASQKTILRKQITRPYRHYIAVVLPYVPKHKNPPFSASFYRLDHDGIFSIKRMFHGSERVGHASNTTSAREMLKNFDGEGSFFCGFFYVPKSVKDSMESILKYRLEKEE